MKLSITGDMNSTWHLLLIILVGMWLVSASGGASSADIELAKAELKKRNYEAAYKELEPLAKAGNAEAQTLVGVLFARGLYVKRHDRVAFQWHQKAAAQNYPEALYYLSEWHSDSLVGQQDYGKASQYRKKSAELGYPPAQYAMGNAHLQGVFATKDPSEAAKWYERSAKQGHAPAQMQLANLYGAGLGVKKDESVAFQWISRAAATNYVPALKAMVRIYNEGLLGQQKSTTLAEQWLNKLNTLKR
jgi:uncharacterized protein